MSGNNGKATARHYLVVATGCVLMMMCTGITFSCAGIFFTPITQTMGVGLGQVSMWMTIALLSMTAALPFAGRLVATKDLRLVLSGAVLLIGLGEIAFSFASTVWVFYVAAVPLGAGLAVTGYLAVPMLMNRWFKERSGFWLGVCMAFSGIGGVLFNPIGGWLIGTFGWSTAYLVFGVLILAVALPFTLFAVRSYPADCGLSAFGDAGEPAVGEPDGREAAKPAAVGVSASVAMKSAAFLALAVFVALVGFGANIYQFMPSFASSLPIAATATTIASTLASFAMAGQALGKIGLGTINDKTVMGGLALAMVCGGAGVLLLWLLPVNEIVIYAAGFLFGVFYASTLVQVPIMARTIFGLREYDRIYSRLSMVSSLVSAFSVTIWGFLTQFGGFGVLWIGGLIIVVLGFFLGSFALKSGARLEQTAE